MSTHFLSKTISSLWVKGKLYSHPWCRFFILCSLGGISWNWLWAFLNKRNKVKDMVGPKCRPNNALVAKTILRLYKNRIKDSNSKDVLMLSPLRAPGKISFYYNQFTLVKWWFYSTYLFLFFPLSFSMLHWETATINRINT